MAVDGAMEAASGLPAAASGGLPAAAACRRRQGVAADPGSDPVLADPVSPASPLLPIDPDPIELASPQTPQSELTLQMGLETPTPLDSSLANTIVDATVPIRIAEYPVGDQELIAAVVSTLCLHGGRRGRSRLRTFLWDVLDAWWDWVIPSLHRRAGLRWWAQWLRFIMRAERLRLYTERAE